MAQTPKGIRMVNENIVQEGRGLIVNDRSAVDWNLIPDGSLYINPETGLLMVKLKGETDWVAAGLKNDGTIVISRDTSVCVEVFTVITLDNGDGTFTYENSRGQRRNKPFDETGYVFELEEGSYIPGRNHLVVMYDDVLERSQSSGGIIEIDERRFKFAENIVVGTEVTAKYYKWVRIGNPYPRIYMTSQTSETPPSNPESAEVGDWFLDFNATVDGFTSDETDVAMPPSVSWTDIVNKPTTLVGYGITDKLATKVHSHKKADITDFPSSMTANGGNADFATRASVVGSATASATFNNNAANTLLKLNGDGKVDSRHIDIPIIFQPTEPAVKDNYLWVKTTNPPSIYVGISGAWKQIASFYS